MDIPKSLVGTAVRTPATEFPLDDNAFDIQTMPQETLIAYGRAAPIIYSMGGVKIVRLSRSLVLKKGIDVLASEGETMKYIKEHLPNVRLPTVYRNFNVRCESSSYYGVKGYIVMDYIDCPSLESQWKNLSREAQEKVVAQVASMVGELQRLEAQTPCVLGEGHSYGVRFRDYDRGPVPSNETFVSWMNGKLGPRQIVKQAAVDIPNITKDRLVLVHEDISLRNLILDDSGHVWLLDWEYAGFYPPVFEARAVKRAGYDFPDFAQLLLPLIYNEPIEPE